jgi:hypothetical protein
LISESIAYFDISPDGNFINVEINSLYPILFRDIAFTVYEILLLHISYERYVHYKKNKK